jgi:hypothetical protein
MNTALPTAAGTSAFHAGFCNGDDMADPTDVEIPKNNATDVAARPRMRRVAASFAGWFTLAALVALATTAVFFSRHPVIEV